MKKFNPKLTIAIFSFVVGILIATQMKIKVDSYVPATLKSIQTLKSEIHSVNKEIAELNRDIRAKEEELSVLENISESDENIIDLLSADLKYNKTSSGYTAVEGPGIEITMYDNPNEEIMGFDINDDVIHDVDVLNILNDLKVAGAEVISINDQRVLSSSEIKCAGPVLRINDVRIGTPFIIRAIGDPKVLMASVNAPDTYGDTLKSVYYIGFEPVMKDKIYIPAYTGMFSFNYAKGKGEGDN
jgi:uncharacterized protein YlxW (UPF0749 family)